MKISELSEIYGKIPELKCLKGCTHSKVELLGEQKGEKGVNRYYRCLKCGSILILSENGVLYQVLKEKKDVS